MDDCKPIKTPMPTNGHLDLNEGGKSVDQTLYRSMIGSLLYLTASRPDIMFSVCMCAHFQANPKESHLSAIKRILRYLKHTPSIGLWYPKDASFTLLGYSDSDFAGCRVDRKSTSGGVPHARAFLSLLVVKETKFRGLVYRGGGIHCRRGLLCSNPLHEAKPLGLWCSIR